MITGSVLQFPQNVVDKLYPRLQAIDPDLTVLRRALRPTDPVQSIGIYCATNTPDEQSYEMRGIPTVGMQAVTTYSYDIQCLNKNTDEVEGVVVSAELTERVRDMLYDTPALRIELAQLTATRPSGRINRLQSCRIKATRYLQNQQGTIWVFLSTTTLDVEVERV